MTTRRRSARTPGTAITAAAVAAFIEAARTAATRLEHLHTGCGETAHTHCETCNAHHDAERILSSELRIAPWEVSPAHVHEGPQPAWERLDREQFWIKAQAQRVALLEAAGLSEVDRDAD